MKHRRLTRRKLKSLIREESMSSKEYMKLGFSAIAKDEKRHVRILRKKLKEM